MLPAVVLMASPVATLSSWFHFYSSDSDQHITPGIDMKAFNVVLASSHLLQKDIQYKSATQPVHNSSTNAGYTTIHTKQ